MFVPLLSWKQFVRARQLASPPAQPGEKEEQEPTLLRVLLDGGRDTLQDKLRVSACVFVFRRPGGPLAVCVRHPESVVAINCWCTFMWLLKVFCVVMVLLCCRIVTWRGSDATWRRKTTTDRST